MPAMGTCWKLPSQAHRANTVTALSVEHPAAQLAQLAPRAYKAVAVRVMRMTAP
jgi:hypothetical protein